MGVCLSLSNSYGDEVEVLIDAHHQLPKWKMPLHQEDFCSRVANKPQEECRYGRPKTWGGLVCVAQCERDMSSSHANISSSHGNQDHVPLRGICPDVCVSPMLKPGKKGWIRNSSRKCWSGGRWLAAAFLLSFQSVGCRKGRWNEA